MTPDDAKMNLTKNRLARRRLNGVLARDRACAYILILLRPYLNDSNLNMLYIWLDFSLV